MNPATSHYALDKSSALPLYSQLKQQIVADIDSGRLKTGELMPSESDFIAALGISRPTVRQALGDLVAEGYVQKQRGRGSFVSHPSIQGQFLAKLQTFDEEMRQQRLTPSTKVVTLQEIDGIPTVNDRLGLPHSQPLLLLGRLRFADKTPVVYVETRLPQAPFAGLLEADLEHRSLYDALEQDYGTRVSRVARTIEASAARVREADLLQVKPGSPICLVHTTGYTTDNRAIEYSVASYRGDMMSFSIELYR